MTPYITHRGTKGFTPFARPDHILDAWRGRRGGYKASRFDITRFFNSQLAPSIISHLEVCRVN